MRDITAQKLAEDNLRTSEERFRALVTASSDVLYRMNSDWTEMYQLGGGGFLADTNSANSNWLQEYIPPDDQRAVLEAIEKAIQSKTVFELEHRVLRVDGTVGWTHSRAVPLFDATEEITEWFGAATDITQRKAAEMERDRATAELARSNEDLSQFAHVVTHDLKTPIRSIRTFGQLLNRQLAEEGKLDSKMQHYVHQIQSSVDSMNRLIDTLLAYALAGQHPLAFTSVPLDTVLAAILNTLRPLIDETSAKIESEPLPNVFGDRTLLEQVLQNLIGNGIKYRKPAQPPCIVIKAESCSADWVISIMDNGQGIDPRYHEQIFAPFKRLHGADVEGTGIGLAICKRIVERHGGRIWVESRSGQGAAFYFTLPKHAVQ